MRSNRKKSGAAVPEQLKQAIRDGRIFHAYLFEGAHEDTEAMAETFAAAVLCSRQDGSVCGTCSSCKQIRDGLSPYIFHVNTLEEPVRELGDTGRAEKRTKPKDSLTIKDKQIEDIIERSRGSSLSSSRVITIIDRADTITPRGQSRLLKVLEEPPESMMIIMVADNAESLLETIRSRCQTVRVKSEEEDIDTRGAFVKRAVMAAAGILAGVPAADLWKEIDYFADSREKAVRFAETAMMFYRDTVVYGQTGRRDLITLTGFEQEVMEMAGKADREAAVQAAEACGRAVRDLKAQMSMKHALRYMMFDIQLFHGVNDR